MTGFSEVPGVREVGQGGNDPASSGRLGVIDIGSNSIRLVVYEGRTRSPSPVFNEKVVCGLGRNISQTGRLDAQGVEMALSNLPRFVVLCEAMGVVHLDVLATAAVREASDGPAFVAEIERLCQVGVKVLSGKQEARLAALGVISSAPQANGLMGDLGGGSLELVALNNGEPGHSETLPLGVLRLAGQAGDDPLKVAQSVADLFAPLPWFESIQGRDLYAVGGAWRALGRIHMARTDYPLDIVHNYVIERSEAEALVAEVATFKPKQLEKFKTISRRRRETVPYAAAVLGRLLTLVKPARLVFSGFGLREGQIYSLMSEAVRAQDPLIAVCTDLARRYSRFALHGEELLNWMDPLFADETAEERKLRLAACLLGDIAWRDHSDFRASQAFKHILLMPVVGIDHPSRIFLALATYARYKGDMSNELVGRTLGLLDKDLRRRAVAIGNALRFATSVSGGAPHILANTQLSLGDKTLTLTLRDQASHFSGEALEKSLKDLAKSFGRNGAIEGAICRRPES